MPILHVKALPQKDPEKIPQALKAACLAIADFFDCPPEQVWATWEEIRPGFYAEGNNVAEIQPEQTHPPLAHLICFEGATPAEIEGVLLAASKALGKVLDMPDNVFITYGEAKSGQVVAGNGVIRK